MSDREGRQRPDYRSSDYAAKRAAHAEQVRLDRQKKLDAEKAAQAKKDADAKRQKMIESYKRVAAKRLADLKAAEKKAAAKASFEKAEQRKIAAQKEAAKLRVKKDVADKAALEEKARQERIKARADAAKIRSLKKAADAKKKLVDIPTPGAVGAPMPGTVGAIVHGTVIEVGLKAKEGVTGFLDSFAAHNDKLYAKGNFLTEKEKAVVLKEVQKNPFLAYDLMTGTKPEKPPKTFDEAVNRLNYMVSEMALGGAREVALPFSIEAGRPRRTEDAILQIVGGLLTPSPADYVVSTTFRAMAGAGKEGMGLMRKAMRGVALSSDEALQFEKLVGQYGYSTNDLRKAGTKLNKLSNAEWDDLVKGYENYYDFWKKNPELYGAGAAYKPSALLQFEDILDDLGYEAGEYINFLKTNKLGPTFNPATLAAFASGLKPPTPDLKAFDKIESDLEKFRESQEKMLEELQEKPVITGPVTRTPPKPKEPTEPGYTPKPPEEVMEEEEDLIKPGYKPPPEKERPKQPVPTEPGYKPPPVEEEEEIVPVIPIIDAPPIVEPIIEPVVEPVIEPPIVEPIVPDDPDVPVPEEAAAPPPRMGKKGGMPRNIFRALIGGKSEEYRVQFEYPRAGTESFTVKARSFPQALGQAQGLRRIRKSPLEVDIVQMEEKK